MGVAMVAVLAVLFLFLVLAAAGSGFFFAGKLLFTSNPRLVLREIRVDGPGYWKDHSAELAARIGLAPGCNLFSLDLKEIRRKLNAVPNVENCSVYRILPDMLVINVIERAPRAFLNRVNSSLVVDGNGIVMPRRQTMRSARLPVLAGVNLYGAEPGKKLKKTVPAMELIMTAVRSFPDITIYQIYLNDPKKLDIRLRYRKFPICRVVMPVENRGFSFMLIAFRSAFINARRMEETRNYYDLSFDGKCVIR
jgi:cell division septal protein FtsQ